MEFLRNRALALAYCVLGSAVGHGVPAKSPALVPAHYALMTLER
jgi:hypothetical protein